MSAPITLKAVVTLNHSYLDNLDLAEQDSYIRNTLADYFVEKIIEEDLIQIQSRYNAESDTLTATAYMTILQE